MSAGTLLVVADQDIDAATRSNFRSSRDPLPSGEERVTGSLAAGRLDGVDLIALATAELKVGRAEANDISLPPALTPRERDVLLARLALR
jgi:hypothetical protein